MRDSSPAVPTLFIYSEGDRLVSPASVREYIGHLRARGYNPEEKVYGDKVGHVASYYSDPIGYMTTVQKFLNKVL